MNYKDFLKTLIGVRGTFDEASDNSIYILRFNEHADHFKNAHIVEVHDDFVIIKKDKPSNGYYDFTIPLTALVTYSPGR